jgi:hypothetical protein
MNSESEYRIPILEEYREGYFRPKYAVLIGWSKIEGKDEF